MDLNRIEAETIEDNHESVRMLEKLGFIFEGIRRVIPMKKMANITAARWLACFAVNMT